MIAFSTASVPALKNAALASEIGASSQRRSAGSDVGLVRHDREIRVAEPLELLRRLDDEVLVATFRQPTPPVKSMKVFPSTSVRVAP